jgi:glyoxylase-like metal-dependent hydrolase (beta-lactamase superfamily II)
VPNDEMKTTVTWGDNFLYIHGDVLTIGDPIFDFMSGMGHTFGHNCLKRGIGFCLDYSSKIGV